MRISKYHETPNRQPIILVELVLMIVVPSNYGSQGVRGISCVRNFMDMVGGKAPINESTLNEMPAPRGRLPGVDMGAEDAADRTRTAFDRLRQQWTPNDPGDRIIDGDAVDMDHAQIGHTRAIPAMGDDVMPPQRPHRGIARRAMPIIDMDDDVPAVPGTGIATIKEPKGTDLATDMDYIPRWIKVSDIAEPFRTAIMISGQSLFGGYTATPVGDIRVLSGITHSGHEVRALEKQIREYGEKMDDMDVTAHGITSHVERWHWRGWETLLTVDPSGPSVWAWQACDGLLGNPHAAAALNGPDDLHEPVAPRMIGRTFDV